MRNLKIVLVILVVTSFAALIGCSQNPSGTNTPANSGSPATNTASNTLSPNTAANNTGPSNSVTAKNEYPQSVTDEFVTACEGTGAQRQHCECVFEKVKQQYTVEEFSEIESKINAGEPADDFVEFSEKAREECMK